NTGHQPEIQRSIGECFDAYFNLCKDRLKWTSHPDYNSWKDLQKSSPLTPTQWFQSHQLDPDDNWEFYYHGGEEYDDASAFRIHGLGSRKWEYDKLGQLS